MKVCIDQRCERKGQLLPFADFSKHSGRDDGLNVYCRRCCCRRTKEYKASLKRKQAARQAALQRKGMVIVEQPKKPTPEKIVLAAIAKGKRTRDEIQIETELHEDRISDVLAHLYDTKTVRIKRVGEEREFHLAA